MRAVTLEDVAAQACVSAKTVSRVVNAESGVGDATRRRVQTLIERLGYRPNMAARNLSSGHGYTIGLVYDNPNAEYVLAMQRGALTACDALNFGVQFHHCDSMKRDLAAELRTFVRRSRLSGLILTPPVSERHSCLCRLVAYHIPLVRVVSAPSDPHGVSPCVYVDDRGAAYAIAAHLLQLGHARIGFLQGGRRHHVNAERLRGYRDAMRHYGVAVQPEWICGGNYIFDDGLRGARRLFELAERPTAIVGCNDEIAAGARAAAQLAGLSVPYDVSLAGFDDSLYSRCVWPPLTTARQAADEIAKTASRMLIECTRGMGVDDVGFTTELIVRGSTAPPGAIAKCGVRGVRRRPVRVDR